MAQKGAFGQSDRAVDLRTRLAEGRGGARRWLQRAAGVHEPTHPGPGGALPRRRTEPGAAARPRFHGRLARLPDAAFGRHGGYQRPAGLVVAKVGWGMTGRGRNWGSRYSLRVLAPHTWK